MGRDYFQGLPKYSRTKGTKLYNVRNYIAYAVIGIGCLFGVALHFSPGFRAIVEYIEDDERKHGEESRMRKLKLATPSGVLPRFKRPDSD